MTDTKDIDSFHKRDTSEESLVEAPEQAPSSLEQDFRELEDKYKRLLADQQNMQKRNIRDREELIKYTVISTIEAILPSVDNCEFALKSLNTNSKIEEVIKGIEMLKTQLLSSLQSLGLEEINSNGLYNAELHEAISTVQDETKPEGSIVEVLRKGFKLKDKILRPAMVVVVASKSQS